MHFCLKCRMGLALCIMEDHSIEVFLFYGISGSTWFLPLGYLVVLISHEIGLLMLFILEFPFLLIQAYDLTMPAPSGASSVSFWPLVTDSPSNICSSCWKTGIFASNLVYAPGNPKL